METELVRAFISVSRNLSFTRAAEELNTTQPLLSRAIRRLEDIIGEQLFDRNSRQIRLTTPGTAFLEEAQDILDQVNRGIRQARAAGHGVRKTLRVGYLPTFHQQNVSRSIQRFRAAHPEVELDFRLMKRDDQAAALRAGELDAGLLDGGVCDRRDLAWDVIGQNHVILAIPSEWGFDPGQPIDLADLKGRPFILPDPDEVPDMHIMLMMLFTRASVEPIVLKYVHDMAESRFLVSAGQCAAFVFATSLLTSIEGIDFIPIRNIPSALVLDFYVIWHPKRMSPTLREFVEYVSDEVQAPEIFRKGNRYTVEWRDISTELESPGQGMRRHGGTPPAKTAPLQFAKQAE
jgi:DNA-binding transcriptional LysR family regulator